MLEDNLQGEALVGEYESILDELYSKGYEQAMEEMKKAVDALALFNITPFSEGAAFYRDTQNLLGILMTAILISPGAPFWFNMLQNLVDLRDTLAPKKNKKSGNQPDEATDA